MRMKNMSYGDIKKAKKFKSDNSIIKPLKSSYKKIKKYIQNNENWRILAKISKKINFFKLFLPKIAKMGV